MNRTWNLLMCTAAVIALAVLSLNLVGEGLNEILNPRNEP